ncbi:MAG: carboxypeptidase regulatory-like domain-containing protein [Terriglobales bacterium]
MLGRMKAVRALLLACLLLAVTVPSISQTTTGRIIGNVHDQSGAAVAGATLTVTDVQRGTARTATSDNSGGYVVSNLQPGIYSVRVEAKGFKTVERRGIQIEVATDVAVEIELSPGDVKEMVVVTADAPLVNTTSSVLGGTLSNKEINDLPLNGRNYENLLQLRPGVTRYPGGGFSTTSANGLRAEDNAYLVEGLFNSEPFSGQNIINGAGIAGDSATILPVDSIQEFNVQQNPPAEYGWKPGAIVNVGLKSGTNSLHGSAYAFGRDTPLDARNYFNTDASGPKNPRQLEQFGGTVGGPIIKDKVFFFGGYEGQRYTVGNSFQISSPATVTLGGDPTNSIPDAIAALQAATVTISPASLIISGCSVGPPITCNGTGFPTNNGTNPNGPTTVVNGFPNTVSSDNMIAKVDYHLNDKNTLGGMYFFGNNSGTVEDFPELQTKWLTLIHTRAQVLGINWAYVPNAKWVNEARFGYNRLNQPTYTADNSVPVTDYGLVTNVPSGPLYGGLPRIGFLGEFQGLGGFKWPKLQGPDTRSQFVDHLAYTRGQHALKFGGEVHRDAFTGGAMGNVRGSVNFVGGGTPQITSGSTPLEDFFAGNPGGGSILVGDPRRQVHNWSYAAFVQDDYRVMRSLTINFGLRYELNTVVEDSHNQLGNFDPTLGLVQVGHQVSAPYNGNHKNFAPRAGFAWDLSGNGRTVIRGGGGVTYEAVNWETFLAFNNSFGLGSVPTGATLNGVAGPGTIQVGNITPAVANPWDSGPLFGNVSPSALQCGGAAPACPIMSVDRNITTPYVYSWTFSVQHAFTPNLSLEAAYVGNHGANLVGIRDINQPAVGSGWTSAAISACQAAIAGGSPGACVGGTDPVAEQAARPFNGTFPYLSNIFQMGNVYKSNYNGLQTTLNARNFHGLSMVAGYTYSHALDDVSANWDFGYGYGLPQDATHPTREYASSDFDVRHRLTLSLTYLIPGTKGYGQMLEGWQINSIVTLSSAQPWGPMDLGTDVSGTGPLPVSPPASSPDRWNFVGNPSDFTSGPSGIPFFLPGIPSSPQDPTYAVNNPLCSSQATTALLMTSLEAFGCYQKGKSAMTPPALGTFGSMGRNTFRDSGFRNLDFSLSKNFKWRERFGFQGRAEFFNIFNHPNFANPYGGQNGFGLNDPSAGAFGCGCATPDVAAANPVIGSGGSRAVQLGLKITF